MIENIGDVKYLYLWGYGPKKEGQRKHGRAMDGKINTHKFLYGPEWTQPSRKHWKYIPQSKTFIKWPMDTCTLKDLERDKHYTNAFPITNGEQNQEGEPVIRYRYHRYFRLEREKALAKVFLRQWLQLLACGGARVQITGVLRPRCGRLWPGRGRKAKVKAVFTRLGKWGGELGGGARV